MKRIIALALFTIASLASYTSATAQQPGMRAKIPFDFTVGNTWLPAGEYTITSPLQSEVRLQNTNNAFTVTVVSTHSNHYSVSVSELVFLRYGDRYFLHCVLGGPNSDMNLDVTSGKAEKEAGMQEATLQNGHEVLVAARSGPSIFERSR
jgi:hypothetical protein